MRCRPCILAQFPLLPAVHLNFTVCTQMTRSYVQMGQVHLLLEEQGPELKWLLRQTMSRERASPLS